MRNNQERMAASSIEAVQSVFSYVVPTYLVDLPSKGAFYPEGHPLHKKEVVELKEMTGKEEDILYNKSFLEKGIVLDKLLISLLVDRTVNPASLLTIDKNALLLAARVNGYGPEYPIKANCEACGSSFDAVVDLGSLLKIKEPSVKDGVTHQTSGLLLVTLPQTKWRVLIKPLSGADQDILQKIAERRKKNKLEENSLIESMRAFVISINDETDGDQLYTALNSMPAKDTKFLRSVYADCFPNITTTSTVSCTVCGETADMEVPFTLNFFWSK